MAIGENLDSGLLRNQEEEREAIGRLRGAKRNGTGESSSAEATEDKSK